MSIIINSGVMKIIEAHYFRKLYKILMEEYEKGHLPVMLSIINK